MDTRVAERALEDLGFGQGFAGGIFLSHHRPQGLGFLIVLPTELLAQGLVIQPQNFRQGLIVWDLFRQAIGFVEGQVQGPSRILDGRLGRHGSVRDNLRNLARSVFVDDILDDLIATPIIEVDINIRKAHAVRVKEALKQQIVADRVDIGDANAIRHGRSRGGTPTGAHTDSHVPRGTSKILNNQKVTRIAGALNRLEFKVESVFYFGRNLRIPALGPFKGQVTQVGILSTLSAILFVLGI